MSERQLSVAPERLARWLTGFAERHGATEYDVSAERVVVRAADAAVASCAVPFPPLDVDERLPYGGLVDHALRERRVGVVLVRRGGHAAGVFDGTRPVATKVGSRHVQGRTAAGGQSQQRFARRREKQAREAFAAATEVVANLVLPWVDGLDAVVVGGDRPGIDRVLSDRRLARLRDLVAGPHLAVPDPKLVVLKQTPDQFRAVRIGLTEPDTDR